ncbi:TIM-barrel domain-containing protein [Mucilaginibacter sp. SP1R1]|uniref:glycoside hydrolase family 31 protein n=1 Tax=Mucilaginibacter sp. SP1R1 TaxID=2723091 RepID=UPI00183E210F|nr:TIM-barrel domain-containing protein [Mucilaginibacter sp. SP1R1]MBB6147681.1 alpha-D-xyloside xylohydrolase [Mucilaginibacter sp. SP1R1]
MVLISASAWSQKYTSINHGIDVNVNKTNISIQFYSADLVRILKSPEGRPFTKNSLSVIKTPDNNTALKITQGPNTLTIASATTTVKVDLTSGQIQFDDQHGQVLLKEKQGGVTFTPTQDSTTNTFTVSQTFELKDGEAVYGLGQHQAGVMNQRHQKITLKQDNMQIGVPVFYSVKGYAVFWDNYSTTIFNDDQTGTSFSSQIGDCADYYFINGGSADKTIANLRSLTGQAPMLPKWVFGFFQSRERYKTQNESVGVLKKYRALKVPIDGMVQDWQYWGADDHNWNSTEFGNPLFPDPKAMVDSIHQLNGHMIISVWPSFGESTKIYADMQKHGFLYNNFLTYPPKTIVRAYDAFNPEARKLYWSYINKNLMPLNLDGWWLDSTEPDHSRPKESDDNTPTFLGTFRKVRNAYPLMTTGGVYQHQRETTSAKRVVILARSAFAGQQRNGAINWSGDVQSRWDVFRKQISGGLNLSLSGIPYWNSDIGGFFSGGKYPKGVKDLAFHELYVRWFEFAAFCPMFRSHGTDAPREIFQFGAKGNWAYDAQEKFINLRYRLLPYNYSNAWSITSKASTMMRALVMDFANDPKVYDIDNEYLFGKAFLVCPVTDSLYTSRASGNAVADFSTIKKQQIYLPAGTDWFDFWTGDKMKGGVNVDREVPIDIIPLYVKAGSIVPMGPFIQYATEKTDPMEIRVYPGADGSFDLYEDENDNYNYEKGKYSLIHFSWNDKAKTLSIDNRKGSYAGMPASHHFNIVLVSNNNGNGLQSGKPVKELHYTGLKTTVKL